VPSDNDPQLDWATAPQQFREAHQRQQQRMQELEDQARQAEVTARENAMLRAGVDMDHPAAAYFVDGYKGELDAEAIQKEWAKLAPPPAAPPPAGDTTTPPEPPPAGEPTPPNDGATPTEQQFQQTLSNLHGETTPPGGEPTPDPWTDALKGFHESKKQGGTTVQAQRGAFQKIINAAIAGDQRVVSSSAAEAKEKWARSHGYEE
jgi:hypothetical protein